MQLLANDVRIMTDGGGKVSAALNVIEGADHAARFLIGVARKGWREDFAVQRATINGLPGAIVHSADGPVQIAGFEIEGDLIRAVYIVPESRQAAAFMAVRSHANAVLPETARRMRSS